MWLSTALWSCENTMYRKGLAYHVCNRTLHTVFHILSMCGETFASLTASLESRYCTTRRMLAALHCSLRVQIWGLSTALPHSLIQMVQLRHPRKVDLIIAAFYRAGPLALKRPTIGQPGTGLNVLNKLMKSTHRTQAGHDKNLYSCETQPSWEGVNSICLFICPFDSPRRSASGTGGPKEVRCQRGVKNRN